MAASSTAGVDLSSQDLKTASCVIRWGGGRAWVSELEVGVTDEAIGQLLSNDDIAKTGLDVPFGWPIAFADAVFQHSRKGDWPSDYRHADIRAFRFRRTDIHVWQQTGLRPLSVSTDRIGIPTMRAAAFLSAGHVPLDGSGRVVEVYPAAALRQWDLPFKHYKAEKHRDKRTALLAQVVGATRDWLSIPMECQALCEHSDDAFDALIAALVARAAARNEVIAIPDAEHEAAAREGWIHIPKPGSLSLLPDPAARVASASASPERTA
jgi:predicted nuclease with RNAse H fold